VFNCSGRLIYGTFMDRTTYRTAMSTETVILAVLFTTLFATTLAPKWVFAVCVWLIFLTFPGTYSTQPAVTTQMFGQKYGGAIYGFLFTSDIVNNLLVGVMSKGILAHWGYLGLFLILAVFRYRFGKSALFRGRLHLRFRCAV
jgi:MFS family permease